MKAEEAGYWKLWSRIWKRWGIASPIRNDFRARVHEVALGEPRSHKAFSHADYDCVFRIMWKILESGPDFVATTEDRIAAKEEGQCRRLRWKCEERAPVPYLDDIAQDTFKRSYHELDSTQLSKLLATAVNRSRNRNLHGDCKIDAGGRK